MPGAIPPKGRIFPLSQPDSKAMKLYIEEELAKGLIFVKKKDGGLRPCIDYRGLNDITIKFRYQLSLVPAALEQLRPGQVLHQVRSTQCLQPGAYTGGG